MIYYLHLTRLTRQIHLRIAEIAAQIWTATIAYYSEGSIGRMLFTSLGFVFNSFDGSIAFKKRCHCSLFHPYTKHKIGQNIQ